MNENTADNLKATLRYKYKIKRKYFQYSRREVADGAIADTILSDFAAKKKFFIYYSFGSEADTRALIGRLIAEGKEVFLPKVFKKDMLPVPFYGDVSELKKNGFGIEEPLAEPYSGEIDVCITPLLAVNPSGYRLGYGGGYYDRFFLAHPKILKVGMGYHLQITEENFQCEGDVPLDKYVCERGIYSFETPTAGK